FFLGLLFLRYIDVHAHPFDQVPSLIAHGHGTHQHVAKDTVMATNSVFELGCFSRCDDAPPSRESLFLIVGVYGIQPSSACHFFGSLTGEILPLGHGIAALIAM